LNDRVEKSMSDQPQASPLQIPTCCAPARKFYTEGLWVEGEAEAQWERCSRMEGAIGSFAMPDLHPGKGIPIGSALATRGLFYPHLAGNDLGCGVLCAQLEGAKRLTPDALTKKRWLRGAPDLSAWESHLAQFAGLWGELGLDHERNARTIGGGNHFVEISLVEEADFDECGLSRGDFVVLAHSGSRHLGEAVARLWTDAHAGSPARESAPEAQTWLQAHDACLDWARANRLALAESAAQTLGVSLRVVSDATHNAIEKLSPAQEAACGLPSGEGSAFLHRKGASKADGGLAVLPGSRGDFSFILRPLDVEQSGLSLAHGAGRKWKRSDCEGRLSKHSAEDLQKTKLGSRVVCDDKALLFEEAPQAYKDCSSVLRALEEHGLARSVAKLRPLLTLKI
jgi:release factor H-coupled RctB family protein